MPGRTEDEKYKKKQITGSISLFTIVCLGWCSSPDRDKL
jgi:hypothetical protein